MNRLAAIGIVVAILILSGCSRSAVFDENHIYAAWESGLTLIFEDIPLSTSSNCSKRSRQAIRVERASETPLGLIVTQSIASYSDSLRTLVITKNGGVTVSTGTDGRELILPDGFPSNVTEWESKRSLNRIIGRAAARLPGIHFIDDLSGIGIWVETIYLDIDKINSRVRKLYLPNIGEVVTMLWDQNKSCWVTTRQLVSMGFTDTATLPPELLKVS